MRTAAYRAVVATLLLTAPAWGQEVRLANGFIVKGEVKQVTREGLEVQTALGPKTYPWEQLSAGTRYRYQGSYRANFEAIVQGLPPSARTNPPDEVEQPATAAKPAPTDAAPTPAESAGTPDTGGRALATLFDRAPYENVEPIMVSQFPGLQLRTPATATFVGFQYGPGRNEVVYLAFDAKSPGELRDVMFVYAPAVPAYAGTVMVPGFKKGTAESRIASFKKFKLASRFAQVAANYEIECSYALPNTLHVTALCTLSEGDTKSSFILGGQLANLMEGEGVIGVKGILDLPVLWLSLDMSAGSPQLVGNLNMTRLRLVPKEGMETRVSIALMDKDETVRRETVKLDESALTAPYGIVCPLKKLVPGQAYSVRASIDLGPFIGPAVFEDKITVPAVK